MNESFFVLLHGDGDKMVVCPAPDLKFEAALADFFVLEICQMYVGLRNPLSATLSQGLLFSRREGCSQDWTKPISLLSGTACWRILGL